MVDQWFERAMRENAFRCWFQPLVDLSSGLVFAHECLIRLEADELRTGREIMQAALVRGRIRNFDTYARRLAIHEGSLQHEPGTYLFINCFPAAIHHAESCLRSTIEDVHRASLRPSEVVLELVQADPVSDFGHLHALCDCCRREGIGVALDDVAALPDSLDRIAELAPDFIKLDKFLVHRAEETAVAKTIEGLVAMAHDAHIAVIAKEVETEQTAALLLSAGISLMQGRHFGRPSPHMRANTGAALARLMEQLEGHLESEEPQHFRPFLSDT